MKIISFFITLIFSLNSYSQNNSLTFDYFQTHLTEKLNHQEIIQIFGQPNRDSGSGIFIYEYHLTDSTKIIIGCVDRVFYAYHTDAEEKLLHSIIKRKDPETEQ